MGRPLRYPVLHEVEPHVEKHSLRGEEPSCLLPQTVPYPLYEKVCPPFDVMEDEGRRPLSVVDVVDTPPCPLPRPE